MNIMLGYSGDSLSRLIAYLDWKALKKRSTPAKTKGGFYAKNS